MVEYNCLLCSYKTTFTTNYNKHLKSKKHLAKEKELEDKKNNSDSQMTLFDSQMTPNDSQMTPSDSQKTIHQCEFCLKIFSKNSNLHRHIKICKNKDFKKNESKMNPIESIESKNVSQMSAKCQPNVSHASAECQPNVSQMSAIDDSKPKCEYCLKIFTTRQAKFKHLKICKVKKTQESSECMQIEILKKENLLLKENKSLTINNNNNTNNTNNNNCNNTNNGTINYLNLHFNNIQPMEEFIENFKTKFPLTENDRKILLSTYNECDIGLFSDTFFLMMKKYLSKQIDADVIPTMPLVCTDSNLRSIKEYHENGGWKTTQSNKSIDQMIDITNKQIFESENTMMYMNQKQRNKIYTRMKQENSLLSMEMEKNDFEKKKTDEILYLNKSEKNECEEDDPEESTDIDEKGKEKEKEIDYSFINDSLIEKYSLPNAPKLIT